MPAKAVWIMLITAVILFLAWITAMHFHESYRHNAIEGAITQSIKDASVQGSDLSERVNNGQMEISVSEFESDFKEDFQRDNTIKINHPTYSFSFLPTNPQTGQAIKAVKVIVKDDRGTPYPVTAITNIQNN